MSHSVHKITQAKLNLCNIINNNITVHCKSLLARRFMSLITQHNNIIILGRLSLRPYSIASMWYCGL